MTILGDMF